MTERAKVAQTLRKAQGSTWLLKYGRMPKGERKTILQPILANTQSKEVRDAVKLFLRYSTKELEEIAGSRGNLLRWFIPDWVREYDRKWRLARKSGMTVREMEMSKKGDFGE